MVASTPHHRPARFRSILSLALALPVVATMLTLAACLPVAVGDPEQSEVDPALTGAWLWEQNYDNRQMYAVHQYDDRTYLVQMFQYEMQAGRVEPKQTTQYKGWLTELGGERFITLKPLSARELSLPEGENALPQNVEYIVGRVELADEDTLKVRGLAPGSTLLDSVHSREQAEKVIRENAGNDALYVNNTAELRRLGEFDTEEIRNVLDAFHAD